VHVLESGNIGDGKIRIGLGILNLNSLAVDKNAADN